MVFNFNDIDKARRAFDRAWSAFDNWLAKPGSDNVHKYQLFMCTKTLMKIRNNKTANEVSIDILPDIADIKATLHITDRSATNTQQHTLMSRWEQMEEESAVYKENRENAAKKLIQQLHDHKIAITLLPVKERVEKLAGWTRQLEQTTAGYTFFKKSVNATPVTSSDPIVGSTLFSPQYIQDQLDGLPLLNSSDPNFGNLREGTAFATALVTKLLPHLKGTDSTHYLGTLLKKICHVAPDNPAEVLDYVKLKSYIGKIKGSASSYLSTPHSQVSGSTDQRAMGSVLALVEIINLGYIIDDTITKISDPDWMNKVAVSLNTIQGLARVIDGSDELIAVLGKGTLKKTVGIGTNCADLFGGVWFGYLSLKEDEPWQLAGNSCTTISAVMSIGLLLFAPEAVGLAIVAAALSLLGSLLVLLKSTSFEQWLKFNYFAYPFQTMIGSSGNDTNPENSYYQWHTANGSATTCPRQLSEFFSLFQPLGIALDLVNTGVGAAYQMTITFDLWYGAQGQGFFLTKIPDDTGTGAANQDTNPSQLPLTSLLFIHQIIDLQSNARKLLYAGSLEEERKRPNSRLNIQPLPTVTKQQQPNTVVFLKNGFTCATLTPLTAIVLTAASSTDCELVLLPSPSAVEVSQLANDPTKLDSIAQCVRKRFKMSVR